MGGMPRTIHPDLPDDLDHAIEALGNRVRVAILQSLRKTGPATRKDLEVRLGVGSPSLQKHLAVLEELGLVSVDPPRSEGDVRRRLYVVDIASLESALKALNRNLT
jgi:DNA-binding transcriptional ArsR family regulator